MKITNETGTFTIDDNGVLKYYQSTEDNQIQDNVWKCLDIPERVRVIPEDMFRWCHVQQRLTFPKSLQVIGAGDGCAFANSTLPHVELPDTLKELGSFVFGNSTMDSLRIPRGLNSIYNRQFKGARIGTLYLPIEFRCEQERLGFREKFDYGQERCGYIRSMLVNNVEIGELIFE